MNPEAMGRMSARELDAYARTMGFSVSASKTVEEKAAAIEQRRARHADIEVLGISMSVPIKRMHDKRVTDLLAKKDRTDADTEEMVRLVVGDDAWRGIVEAATEEDGTVDNDAIAYAIVAIITNRKLKNY